MDNKIIIKMDLIHKVISRVMKMIQIIVNKNRNQAFKTLVQKELKQEKDWLQEFEIIVLEMQKKTSNILQANR